MTVDDRLSRLSADKRALLEQRLRGRGATGELDAIPARPPDAALPLSFAQQRLWFLHQLDPDSAQYNISQAMRVRGTLDAGALERALSDVVARHESLRSTFATVQGEPLQVVHSATAVTIEVTELDYLEDEKRELEARRMAAAEATRPFDLERGPLLRTRVLRLAPDDHVVVLAVHHIVSDGWSTAVFTRELSVLYEAHVRRERVRLPELPIQYADFAAWQRRWLDGPVRERQLEYWRKRLAGLPPVLELPTDHPRPAVRSGRGASVPFTIDSATVAALRGLGRSHDATLFMVLAAAFQALLSRYSGSDDVAIGSPVAGRTRPEIEGLIGFFVNTLVLRTDLSGDPSFAELVGRVRDVALGAFAHQDLPFEKLVDELAPQRSLSHTPLFQVMLSLQRVGDDHRLMLGDAELEVFALDGATARFDLTLNLVEDGSSVAGILEYDADLFERSSIERMGAHLHNLLNEVAADPGRRLSQVELLSPAERGHVAGDLSGAGAVYPAEHCIHELFEAQATRTPDAVALVSEGLRLSYRELDARANRLARHLGAKGVGPDVPVGICLERGADLVVGLLAILKAGGAYVPLDPDYPPERLAFVLADTAAPVVVTTSALAGRLDAQGAELVLLDAGRDLAGACADTNPRPGASPGSLAYVIYTSGSTGTPKGVAVTHANVARLLSATAGDFGFGESDVWTFFHSFAFDFSVWEIWGALLTGGRLVVVPKLVARSPDAFVELVREQRVTVLNQTPSAFAQFIRAEAQGEPHDLALRVVVFGGEALDPTSLKPWIERHGVERPRLVNMFGITETTVHVTRRELDAPDAESPASPIGRPIDDLRVYILDRYGNPVPLGVPGEIYVGGAGVARGYVNRASLTAERFVPDCFSGVPGARLYRTGDRGRYLGDGDIEFLGRVDDQVKVRGFRIEPGEIEARLVCHEAVRDAVVVALGDDSDKRLVAYVVSEHALTTTELRSFVAEGLPDYMVPAHFVVLDELPLTPNGKLDRGALPAPEGRPELDSAYVAPRTPAEEVLAGIWCDVLGLERVGVHDNFFELGGDSILSIQIVARSNAAGLGLTPRLLFQHQSVAELAAVAGVRAEVVAEQGPVVGKVSLTPIQRWFFERDLPERHHFNQSMLLAADGADAERVAEALGVLVDHHDALRLRFAETPDGWVQANAAVEEHDFFRRVDLSDASDPDGAMAQVTAEVQANLDLEHGPLLRAVLFDLGGGSARLFICIHHLAVDAVSWRILLEDLDAAHAGRALGPKTTSYRGWAERLVEHASSGEALAELDYWERVAAVSFELPVDLDSGRNDVASAEHVTVSLSEAETHALLHEVPGAYRTQVNDVLLAALARALCCWSGSERVLVDLEGHGREDVFSDLDLTRTVGWFTSLFPVALEAAGSDPGVVLKSVKEQLRGVPRRGLGYGVLRHLGSEDVSRRVEARAPVSFNYLGRFGGEAVGSRFSPVRGATGPDHASSGERVHLVEVNGSVSGGALHMAWTYSANRHTRETIERVAGEFVASLRELVAHCRDDAAGGVTPSDFPLAGLDQASLDELWDAGVIDSSTQDLYPLTPLQQGMVFHTLAEPGSPVYFEQLTLVLEGDLDVAALEEAWRQTSARHAPLRSAVLWEGLAQPLQAVSRHAGPPFEVHDLRALPPDERDAALAELLDADRRRGFELVRPPLQRITLVRMDDRRHVEVWSHHHVLLDGWSVATVHAEVLARYHALVDGRAVEIRPAPAYRDYVAWLGSRDRAADESYWRETLAGFAAPTPIPCEDTGLSGCGQYRATLPESTTATLEAMARRHRVTLSTVVQGAWALLLSRYGGEDDVVFGATVSGRPPELPGVGEMVGLFINTIPVRLPVEGSCPVAAWLERIHADGVARGPFEHSALTDVHSWSEVPPGTPLFDSIVVFENYPIPRGAGDAGSDLAITGVGGYERTNYPLTLTAAPGPTVSFLIDYDRSRFEPAAIERLATHLATLLEAMASDPARPLSELDLVSAAERHHLVVELNEGVAHEAPAAPVHVMFEERARLDPGATALVCGDRTMSYGELNTAANRLAHHLTGRGVGPETPVGVCLERGPGLVVTLLAISKAGGTYVPLDPGYPQERVAFMLADAGVPVVVTTSALAERVDAATDVVLVDAHREAITARPDGDPVTAVTGDNVAYVIYTSGSTGIPKGVAVSHGALAGHCVELAERYAMTPADRMLVFASFSFDAAVEHTFAPLAVGASIVVRDGDVWDPETLADRVDAYGITLFDLPTAYWHQVAADRGVAQRLSASPTLRIAAAGGEAMTTVRARQWMEVNEGHLLLLNTYGPTEATITTTAYPLGDPDALRGDTVPIGRPFTNDTVYVLDRYGNPVPVGVPGELYVGGPGVARGYVNRPGLTAASFVPDPFSPVPGARLYRTGDRARHLDDGNVEFLGRVDHQVKIRGFRIEPGEIEARLMAHDAVRDAAVVARYDGGDTRLVAYVVSPDAPTTTELRKHVREALPDYMVPAQVVVLDELPLTPNGKLDRATLPAPGGRPDLDAGYAAPRNPVEEMLAGIWCDVLGLERAGVHDDFFELGGHSLVATQIVSRIRAAFSVELPLRALFESPTVAALADVIAASDRLDLPAIEPVERGAALPLSFAQQRLWFLDKLQPGSSEYNVPHALRVRGPLDVEALAGALTDVVTRHEVLRTTIATVDGEPRPVVHAPEPIVLVPTELGHLDERSRELEARRIAVAEAARPFDLAGGPLLRARVLRLGHEDHVLLLTMHHVVFDGWSTAVFMRELSELYEAHRAGTAIRLPELSVQYADFAAWQRRWLTGDVLDDQLAYWRTHLAGLAPVLELPTDHPRPAVKSSHGKRHPFTVGSDTVAALNALARAHNATLFMTLAAAFQMLLARYSGSEDIAVGTPVAGRTRAEIEGLVGFFVNTLVLRTDLSGDPTFAELVERVRDVALGAYGHQDVPFEKLVEDLAPERDLSHTPLFQVAFSLERAGAGDTPVLGDAELEGFALDAMPAKFDLTLSMVEDGHGAAGVVDYNADLFEPATIARMVAHFTNLLDAVVSRPDAPLSEVDVLTETERNHLVAELNDTAVAYPWDRCIHELFEDRARTTPDALAIVAGRQELSYGDLDRRANRLAHHLAGLGVGPETPVAICLERGTGFVVAALAILKAGGAYVPLDPAYPKERLRFMLEDAAAPVVVTTSDLAGGLGASGADLVLLDAHAGAIAACPDTSPERTASPDGLAYVVYTSGSTGTPKGVAVSHRSLVNLVSWHVGSYGIEAHDRAAHVAPLGFDASVWELWPYLGSGASVALPPEEVRTSPVELVEWLNDSGVTVTFVPTALVHELFAGGHHSVLRARAILTGGDQLRVRPDDEASFELVNHYGPTEATVVATAGRVEAAGAAAPSIGRPIANAAVYILDRYGNPVPLGVPGEIYVGGAGVARGYVNRAALTAERFVPDCFSGVPGARLYRTGDRGRYLGSGDIEFLGRVDDQVKVRGFRIEPGEIEARLVCHEAVRDAVVVALGDDSDKRLVAYVVSGEAPTTTELRSFVADALPDYMVPAHFVVLDELPLTPNGKLDRSALPAPEGRPELDAAYVAPRTPAEEVLAGIWCEVLGVERVGVHDNFFELGGHSMIAIRVASKANTRGMGLAPRDVFEHPTLHALARLAEIARPQGYDWESPVVFNGRGDREAVALVNPATVTTPYWYADLARALGTRHPSFALQPLCEGPNADVAATIEDMAEKCMRDLAGLWRDAPGVVGGWSLGALVAWEMACRMHSAGRRPRALVLIDPPRPAAGRDDPAVPDDDAWFDEAHTLLRSETNAVVPGDRRQRLADLFEIGGIPRYYADLPVEDLTRFVVGSRVAAAAEARYEPRPYPGDVLLFVSVPSSEETAAERAEAWRPLIGGDLVTYASQGTHHTILLDEHARLVAREVAAYLQQKRS